MPVAHAYLFVDEGSVRSGDYVAKNRVGIVEAQHVFLFQKSLELGVERVRNPEDGNLPSKLFSGIVNLKRPTQISLHGSYDTGFGCFGPILPRGRIANFLRSAFRDGLQFLKKIAIGL